ncbi:MAG: UbiA family prenyltransferase [Actinomycetes bacterium]
MHRAVALARAAHPEPTAAVTVLATTVAAAAGRDLAGCVVVAAAVLSGQLSIGWSNDVVDVRRDRVAGRLDKPLASDLVSVRTASVACGVAVLACVPLSLASGWRAGLAHLVGVAGGWAYNLGMKRTVLSWLPYAVSFALLVAFLSLGLPGHPAPAGWALLAGGLFGVGAHCLNVVPDLADDLAAGVRGLPHRLGERGARALGALLLATAAAVVTLGPEGEVPVWAWVGFGLAVALALLAATSGARAGSRLPFLLALGSAAVAVGLLVGRGSHLT